MYCTYSEWTSSGGEICEGQEDQSYPSYEDEYREYILKGCYKTQPQSCQYSIPDIEDNLSAGDLAYIVIVRYTNGSTFGCCHGNGYIVAVLEDLMRAEQLAESIRNKTYSGYTPWSGYFEYLDSCEIETMIVEK